MTDQPLPTVKACNRCHEVKPLTDFSPLAKGTYGRAPSCRSCANAKARANRALAGKPRDQLRREIKDDLWSAMFTGRSRRALTAVRPRRTGRHLLRLRDGSGHISVSELACRCLEREAVFRAADTCKSHADTGPFIRALEQGTVGLTRRKEMQALARTPAASRGPSDLSPDASETDPFAEAFGDWTPEWVLGQSYPHTMKTGVL